MNKRELVDAVCSNLETTKAAAEDTVNVVLKAIQEGLQQHGQVSVAGFGTWTVRERAARTGRNPQTGEPMEIKASNSVGFKPAKAWKDALN
ncbi:MAG: HU family DNA-binding protein [Planctomycetota bacterium]|jgi:DNA-binding protein HU-beta